MSFEGEGCAISLASASILTDILKGKDFSLASGIIENFLDLIKKNKLLTLNSIDESQKPLMSLSGVKDYLRRNVLLWLVRYPCFRKKNEN